MRGGGIGLQTVSIITTPVVPVPNPLTALSQLTPDHRYFTVIDLAHAFFCLPLHQSLHDISSFIYKGHKHTYPRMPQGFCPTPGMFTSILRDLLAPFKLDPGVLLVQYVDDILLAAPTAATCLANTEKLLRLLFEAGFKIPRKKKNQCCRSVVSFFIYIFLFSISISILYILYYISIWHNYVSISRDSIINHPLPGSERNAFLSWPY